MKFEAISPELQEKIAACKTPEDLFALAKEEGRELSDDEIEMIAGGEGPWDDSIPHLFFCPHCNGDVMKPGRAGDPVVCPHCGKTFPYPSREQ